MNDITWTGEHAAEWAGHYGGKVAQADPADATGATSVRHRMLSALRQALGEPFHVSNSGIGPGAAAWATLIVEGPYYVDITVRPAGEDKPGSAPAHQLRERMATAWASALETGDVSGLNDVLPPDEEPSA